MFELWSIDTANAVGEYATLDDALADVREMIALHGVEVAANWGLFRDDGIAPVERIAIGPELVRAATASSQEITLHD